jgi:hypothetical protein
MISIIGTSSTSLLKKGDVVRVVLGKAYSWLNDDKFAEVARDFWSQIDFNGKAYTISPNPAILDGKPVVIDIRISVGVYVSILVAELETISGFYADVVSLELLKPEAAKVSAGEEGAKAREGVKADAAEAADDGSFAGKIASMLKVGKTLVTVGLIGAAIVAVIVYAPQIKAVARKAGVK